MSMPQTRRKTDNMFQKEKNYESRSDFRLLAILKT